METSTMSSGPSITVPAEATIDLHGHSSGTFRLPVTDSGSTVIHVHGSVRDISPRARAHPASSWITSITPSTLTIRPHAVGYLTVHVQVPKGSLAGPHFFNLIAATGAVSTAGPAREAVAVGGTIRILHAGHKAVPHAAPPSPSGFPFLPVGIAALLVLLAGTAALALRLRRNHHRR